jgi:ABC-type glutathione transport system ATPase component
MGTPNDSQIIMENEKRRDISATSPPRLKDEPPLATSATSDDIRAMPTNTSHGDNTISLREVDPVSIYLDHLNVTVDQSPSPLTKILSKKKVAGRDGAGSHVKTILDDISADMQSGTLTAIIGGSGSGKTSLLNQMSGRLKGNRLSVSGRTLFNGSEDASGVRSAYVIQQDILLPTLTVRETLMYAAQLRLPPSINQEERKRLVEEVIMELSLKEAADTRIGNHEHRGCSGGEKRRTSIGVQV